MSEKTIRAYPQRATRQRGGGLRLEFCGAASCIVEGLETVLEYSDEKIRIAGGGKQAQFCGADLRIDSFTPMGAVIEGMIVSVSFSDADKAC